MRISWLSADEVAAARRVLTAEGASYDDHFRPDFILPDAPANDAVLDWPRVIEHVARAERVSAVVREQGLAAARVRFGDSGVAIEAATLAAAAHAGEELGLDEVIAVLRHPIDTLVFYAPFLELLIELGKPELDRTVRAYEEFVEAYVAALSVEPHGGERIGAVRDGLADFYVFAGRTDEAEALFERRHDEDQGDVAVALSASRAYLAAGSLGLAVRWLGVGAARATVLGRDKLAERLRTTQQAVRKRLS